MDCENMNDQPTTPDPTSKTRNWNVGLLTAAVFFLLAATLNLVPTDHSLPKYPGDESPDFFRHVTSEYGWPRVVLYRSWIDVTDPQALLDHVANETAARAANPAPAENALEVVYHDNDWTPLNETALFENAIFILIAALGLGFLGTLCRTPLTLRLLILAFVGLSIFVGLAFVYRPAVDWLAWILASIGILAVVVGLVVAIVQWFRRYWGRPWFEVDET